MSSAVGRAASVLRQAEACLRSLAISPGLAIDISATGSPVRTSVRLWVARLR